MTRTPMTRTPATRRSTKIPVTPRRPGWMTSSWRHCSEAWEITADRARAAEAAARLGQTAALAAVEAMVAGRRGPGMPGSVQAFPGEPASPAAGFASGKPLDIAPGCAGLGSFLEEAAGDG
jgi:hypothetical protein